MKGLCYPAVVLCQLLIGEYLLNFKCHTMKFYNFYYTSVAKERGFWAKTSQCEQRKFDPWVWQNINFVSVWQFPFLLLSIIGVTELLDNKILSKFQCLILNWKQYRYYTYHSELCSQGMHSLERLHFFDFLVAKSIFWIWEVHLATLYSIWLKT